MRARIFSRTARLVLAVIVATSMVAVVAPGASAAATTYYVDPVSGSNAAGGTTEGTAFKTITYALDAGGAVDGDTIMCLPGTYSNTSNGETFPIDLTPGVALVSKMGAATTIIDMEGSDGSSVLEIWNPTANTTLQGFTVSNGPDLYPVVEVERWLPGSADGWPLIEDNVFDSHEDIRYPVIFLDDSPSGDRWLQPRIIGNEFAEVGEVGEQLPDEGGAIKVGEYVDVQIEGNYFHDLNVGNYGAAIYISSGPSRMDVIDNTFRDCYAGAGGGAINIDGPGGSSAAIEALIENNYFDTNESGNDGGAIQAHNVSDLTIRDNKIGFGYASDDGGALYSEDCTMTVENNWIYDCTAEYGGGAVYARDTEADFINNTVYGNVSTTGGSWNGIHKEGTGTFNVINSIFWGNGGEDVEGTKIRNSCTEDTDLANSGTGNTVGVGNIHTDPLFFDADAGDLRLELGSPCVDAGDDASAPDKDIFGESRPQDGDGDGSADVDIGGWEKPEVVAGRVAGADRYATAADAAMDAFDGEADTAVIASGQNFPDALSAAGLCGSYEAPLLLTRTASLPPATAQALSDMGVTDVFIVGGTGAVSSAVENALKADYNVTRIFGATRYDTSALVAEEIADHDGGDFSKRAFFARGDAFPDALAVSPYSYSDISPILLVRPTMLPSVIAIAMNDLDIEEGYVCGGTGAVSDTVKAAIDVVLVANGGGASERWGGADRYATAVTIATGATGAGYGNYQYVGIATGMNFPDALAGGVGAGAAGGAVLLTRTSSLPPATAVELTKRKAQVVYCEILGGEGAVASSVKTSIESALGW